MAEKERKPCHARRRKTAEPRFAGERASPETVIPPNWAPDMLAYADVSRMLFRMHRNVAAHMDAQSASPSACSRCSPMSRRWCWNWRG